MHSTVPPRAALALLCAAYAAAHVPYLDDGSHASLTTAWPFPDTTTARVRMITFDCPSTASYSRVTPSDNATSLLVGLGIPNATALYDYRPSLWVLGRTVQDPPDYQTDGARAAQLPVGATPAYPFVPHVPRGFRAVEYPSEGSPVFQGFSEAGEDGEQGGGISGYALLRANITLSAPDDVYLVLQPNENRLAKAWISLGTKEVGGAGAEPESASEVDMAGWFSATSTPRLGQRCVPWTA